jgi:hypothetical protein
MGDGWLSWERRHKETLIVYRRRQPDDKRIQCKYKLEVLLYSILLAFDFPHKVDGCNPHLATCLAKNLLLYIYIERECP